MLHGEYTPIWPEHFFKISVVSGNWVIWLQVIVFKLLENDQNKEIEEYELTDHDI